MSVRQPMNVSLCRERVGNGIAWGIQTYGLQPVLDIDLDRIDMAHEDRCFLSHLTGLSYRQAVTYHELSIVRALNLGLFAFKLRPRFAGSAVTYEMLTMEYRQQLSALRYAQAA